MFRMIPASLALAVLLGCASKPAPMAPAEFYETFGASLAVVELCSSKGFMTPETAGKGIYFISQEINKTSYRYFPAQLDQRKKAYMEGDQSKINQQNCTSASASLEAYFLGQARAQQNVSQPAPNPTNTNCTTYFGNTNCISY